MIFEIIAPKEKKTAQVAGFTTLKSVKILEYSVVLQFEVKVATLLRENIESKMEGLQNGQALSV